MSERIFATQGEVLEFLRGLGLKISRTKISSDYRSGRLKCTSDKQFREEDVLAYAESLKAPAVQEKADKAQKLKAELARQKALLSSLLEAVPDDHAVKLALEKWLAKNGDEADDLCGAVREALGRMGDMEPSRHASRIESLPSGLQAEVSPSPAKPLPELVYLVQGSASTPYKVRFRGEGPGLVAFCSCPAGKMSKTFCKHAAALLKGDASRLVDGSADLAALRSRANGSPLLGKAQGYTAKPWSHRETIAAPGAPDQGLKRLLPYMDRLLEQTTLWHEYSSKDDGSESITILVQEFYKNGTPRKQPTQLLSLSYEPIKYQYVHGKWNDEQEAFEAGTYKAVGKRSLPYLVNSTNYGTLDTSWTAFLQKLEELLPRYADSSPHQG